VYISLTGFTGWSEVLSAREMYLLASPLLAVINIVHGMFVEWTEGLKFVYTFQKLFQLQRLKCGCFRARDQTVARRK
jgi:hypothetical protein